MIKVKEIYKAIGDFFWVLQAYLRGKVLRQKAYRPQPNSLFKTPAPVTFNRIEMLLKWWGYRLPTAKEAIAIIMNSPKITNTRKAEPPLLNWNGENWEINKKPIDSNWYTRHRIIVPHR